jgi:predicted DNA-binding transcriptional regulator AlpA
MSDDLVPHKTMLTRLGLSRTSVWRAMHSNMPDFPKPVIIRRKVLWNADDVARIASCMERYCGRGEFDKARRVSKLIAQSASKAETRIKGKRKKAKPDSDRRQLDLFGRT